MEKRKKKHYFLIKVNTVPTINPYNVYNPEISTTLHTIFSMFICNRFFLQLIIFFTLIWLHFLKTSPSARLLSFRHDIHHSYYHVFHFPFSNQHESSLYIFIRDQLLVKTRKRTERLPTMIMRHENESNPIFEHHI